MIRFLVLNYESNMWHFIIGSFLVLAPVLGAPHPPNHRIIGGDNATITDYPYAAQVEYYYLACGGVIVASDWVLTAGNCLHDRDIDVFVIRVGTTDRARGGDTFSITEVVYHPQYDADENIYNVALLRLNASVSAPHTEIVKMAEAGSAITAGSIITVLGWGWVNEDYLEYDENFADTLQVLEVPILDDETCVALNAQYGVLNDAMFCGGFVEGGKGFCYGDVGGPVMYEGLLIALTSWTDNCARAGRPGVFTKVSSIRSWIDEVIST